MSALTPKAVCGLSVVINTTLLKDRFNESGFVYVFGFVGILYSLARLGHNYLRFDISQDLFIHII